MNLRRVAVAFLAREQIIRSWGDAMANYGIPTPVIRPIMLTKERKRPAKNPRTGKPWRRGEVTNRMRRFVLRGGCYVEVRARGRKGKS